MSMRVNVHMSMSMSMSNGMSSACSDATIGIRMRIRGASISGAAVGGGRLFMMMFVRVPAANVL